ncbi:MAG: nucleotidyltransferase domain-containing protein [Treponema sp.]|jgi:predicted nucleotidyltransferase|nr:nucleotidyltransferase domain-containing protein [Treponema sp.]
MAVDIKEINRIARSYAEDVKQIMPVEKAVLFGSYAKGYASGWSDVDICFFLSGYNGKERVDILTELFGMTGKYPDAPIEPLVFESAEMQNGNPFVREILATGKEL